MSKFQSRELYSGICWQKKKRDEFEKSYDGPRFWEGVDLSFQKARVRHCTIYEARKIIAAYEWLGTLPSVIHFYGLYFDDRILGGVECVSSSGQVPAVARRLGLPGPSIAYLSRGACAHWTPTGSATFLVSKTLKLLRKKGFAVAYAFADRQAGEIGTIYQATNWIFLGFGADSVRWIRDDGRIFSNQQVTTLRARYKCKTSDVIKSIKKKGWTPDVNPGKGAYLYILDDSKRAAIMDKIRHLITDYPKRAGSIAIDASIDQIEKGGVTPTPALQTYDI